MNASKKKYQLKSDITDENRIIGISSHENDYRLSWALNNQFNISLKKVEDLIIEVPEKDTPLKFSTYLFYDENSNIQYKLLSNRCENGYLLKEYKNIDYILHLKGNFDNNDINYILQKIKKNECVLFSFIIDINNLKNKFKTYIINY
jgi:hypothetical protein